jgi:localization factor PodJL
MKPGGPWSVKGIEPEVRETAKSAARRAGKTLGEWLNQVIMETGQELDTADILRNSEAWADLQAKAPWSEVVDDLAQKFEASEERHNALLKNIDLAIGGLAEKLNQRSAAEADRQLDPEDFREVSERIDELETQSKRALSKDDLVTVEKAMSNVALVLDASERLDEALATLEAGSQSGQEADAQTDILNTISDDMARLDDRLRDTHDRSEQALENVHRNISSIITRLDESDTLTNDALISSIARTETSLTDVTNRLGAIEAHENGRTSHSG